MAKDNQARRLKIAKLILEGDDNDILTKAIKKKKAKDE